jgi:hypothetical protein
MLAQCTDPLAETKCSSSLDEASACAVARWHRILPEQTRLPFHLAASLLIARKSMAADAVVFEKKPSASTHAPKMPRTAALYLSGCVS